MIDEAALYQNLRQEGISLLSRLTRSSWTDHNLSDPGITLLELLCYAICDLEYRAGFKINDHVAQGGNDAYSALFSPKHILHTAPVIPPDYRKALMDLKGIKNVDLAVDEQPEPAILYAPFSGELLLARDKDPLLPDDIYKKVFLKGIWKIQAETRQNDDEDIETALLKKISSLRTLCTDYSEISILGDQPVRVEVGIELHSHANHENLLMEIFEVIEHYISPSLNHWSLQDMLNKYVFEKIFDGPALEKGFIDPDEFSHFKRRTDLRRSDLIHKISKLSHGVKAVRYLNFGIGSARAQGDFTSAWLVTLDKDRAPVFDYKNSPIVFYKGDTAIPGNFNSAVSGSTIKKPEIVSFLQSTNASDTIQGKSKNRHIGRYNSIRNHIPELFGISPAGLPPGSDQIQHVSARQFGAYLMFFEQFLANFFSQLEQAWKLFSLNRDDFQSYFVQALDNKIKGIEELYVSNDSQLVKRLLDATEDESKKYERTERFLDHLLARFSESFNNYTLLQKSMEEDGGDSLRTTVDDKRAFLKDYPESSARRGSSFDYTSAYGQDGNIEGLKLRIARMAGIENIYGTVWQEGDERFYILEHILLRPRPGDAHQEHPLLANLQKADPYSLQISFIFCEVGRFKKDDFRTFMVRLIREETPAHLQTHIYWITEDQMRIFEEAYREFLEELASPAEGDHQFRLRITRDYLLNVLYGAARLSFKGWTIGKKYGSISGFPYPFKDQPVPLKDLPVPHPFRDQPVPHPFRDLPVPYPLRDLPVPYPLRDLPVLSPVIASRTEDGWIASISINYAQKNVKYILTDRYKTPIDKGAYHVTPDINGETVTLQTPAIDEDKTYLVRAESVSDSYIYVYLKQKVRVHISVAEINVDTPVIDYGVTEATLNLVNTQAGVDYRVYEVVDEETEHSISREDAAGDANADVEIIVRKDEGFFEDTSIKVYGSLDDFNKRVDVWEGILKVLPNPDINIEVDPIDSPHGGSERQRLFLSGNTQKSVIYKFYYIEVADYAFVHQKDAANRPDENQLLVIIEPVEVIIQKLKKDQFPKPWEHFDQEFQAGKDEPKTVNNDGDSIEFDLGYLQLKEDTLFIVQAYKPWADNGTHKILLHNLHDFLHMGVALIYPKIIQDDQIKPIAGRRVVELHDAQPGVKYFLRLGGINQKPVFYHDTQEKSVRRDGVGHSKVGTDIVAGPPYQLPLSLSIMRVFLGRSVVVDVIAEKIQTGMQKVIKENLRIQVLRNE